MGVVNKIFKVRARLRLGKDEPSEFDISNVKPDTYVSKDEGDENAVRKTP